MADLAQIAQSGIDPATGSYLSAEKRKSLFKRNQVSSNIFSGRGALVPVNKQSDPETLAIVRTQSTSITSLQSQVNSLRTEVGTLNAIITNQTKNVNGIQEQINGLKGEVVKFGAPLSNVVKSINNDTILEQNQIKQQEDQQRKTLEEGLRSGRESFLEKALQTALIAPVAKVAAKAKSILGSLSELFGTLLLGWLTNQGIETLRAESSGNRRKLEDIKRNVLQSLGISAAILLTLNGGFLRIAGTIANLSLKIGGWVLKNTIGKFFGAIGNILKGLGGPAAAVAAGAAATTAGGGATDDAARAATTTSAQAAGTADDLTRAAGGAADDATRATAGAGAGAVDDAARAATGVADDVAKTAATKGAGGLLSKLLGPVNIAAAGYRYSQGDMVGGTLSAASAVPGVGLIPAAIDISRELGAFEGTLLGKNQNQATKTETTTPDSTETPQPTPAQTSTQTEDSTPKVTPDQTSTSTAQPEQITPATLPPPSPEMVKNFEMAWKYKDNSMFRGRIESAWNNMSDEQQQQAKVWGQSKGYDWNEMRLKERNPKLEGQSTIQVPQPQKPTEALLEQPTPAQTDKIPSQLPNVGPEPTPPPNVIYSNVNSPNQQQSSAQPSNSGPINQPPSISASNPDNFYVLYSKVNYNVVA
jgi:cell division protein FtsL